MISWQQNTVSRVLHLLKSYSKSEIGSILFSLFVGLTIIQLPVEYNITNGSSVLTTLAIIQATLLGIVFSVSILGVQLIADRYSARMVTVVTSSAAFKGMIVLFSVSVGIDLFLNLSIPIVSAELSMAGVAVAAGFAGAFGLAMKRYVDMTIIRSTPEGLLEAYASRITPESYREAVSKSENSSDQHPIHEFHEMVMTALSRNEWSTAENGIKYIEDISTRILSQEVKANNLHPQRDNLSKEYFQPTLEQYLPRITIHAVKTDEEDLATQSVDSIEKIGKTGIESARPHIGFQSATGLSEVFRNSPDGEKGRQLRWNSLDGFQNLILAALSEPAPTQVSKISSLYSSRLRVWLGRDHQAWIYEQHLADFYRRCLVQGLEQYLSFYGEYFERKNIDWESRNPGDSHPKIASAMISLLRYIIKMNFNIFRYRERNDDWPINPSSLREGWLSLCKISANNGPIYLSETLIRYYIDSAYVISLIDPEASTWSRKLAKLKGELSDGKIVDRAVSTSKSDGPTSRYGSFIQQFNQRHKPDNNAERFYQFVSSNEQGYYDWIDDFHENMISDYEEYYSD